MPFADAIQQVAPETIYLFSRDPETVELNVFLTRLAGLVKYALTNYQGEVKLLSLAAGTGQREITVRKGLEWLVEHGDLIIVEDRDGRLKLNVRNGVKKSTDNQAAELKALLEETAAFRHYFRNVNKEVISFSSGGKT